MSFRSRGVVCCFFAAAVAAETVWASCGAASCPIDTVGAERLEKGFVRVDYSYEYIDQDQPKIGSRDASVGEIRGHHDEISTLNETRRVNVEAGLSDRLSVQASLPFIHREHQHVHHHHGSDILSSWNFTGMGDLTLLSRYAVVKGGEKKARLAVIAGGILPTGQDKAVNDDGDEAEVGILPGKGAYGLILGGALSKNFTGKTLNGQYARLPLFFSSTYQWNEEGVDDYKMGDIWLANVGVVYPVLPKVGFMLQTNLQVLGRDDRGKTREEVQKTGGEYVFVSPGIQLTMAEGMSSYVYVQLPVYQRVNVIQLTSDYNFIAGLSYRFSVL